MLPVCYQYIDTHATINGYVKRIQQNTRCSLPIWCAGQLQHLFRSLLYHALNAFTFRISIVSASKMYTTIKSYITIVSHQMLVVIVSAQHTWNKHRTDTHTYICIPSHKILGYVKRNSSGWFVGRLFGQRFSRFSVGGQSHRFRDTVHCTRHYIIHIYIIYI